MKMKNLFKTAIKWAPVVYPVVRKMWGSRKSKASMATRRR